MLGVTTPFRGEQESFYLAAKCGSPLPSSMDLSKASPQAQSSPGGTVFISSLHSRSKDVFSAKDSVSSELQGTVSDLG